MQIVWRESKSTSFATTTNHILRALNFAFSCWACYVCAISKASRKIKHVVEPNSHPLAFPPSRASVTVDGPISIDVVDFVIFITCSRTGITHVCLVATISTQHQPSSETPTPTSLHTHSAISWVSSRHGTNGKNITKKCNARAQIASLRFLFAFS